jgi:hypothetical protein
LIFSKLSQASVTALSSKMTESSGSDDSTTNTLKNILSSLPIGGGADKMNQGEQLHAQAQGYHFNPDNVAPPEVQKQLLDLLKWRDGVYRDILKKLEMVPGLSDMLDQLTNALNACAYIPHLSQRIDPHRDKDVYTVIAPWLTVGRFTLTSAVTEFS